MTHLLVSGRFKERSNVTESRESLTLISSLASSLPHDVVWRKSSNPVLLPDKSLQQVSFKEEAIRERGELVSGLGKTYEEAMESFGPRAAACAEPLTIAR